jgi:hypothetical protein
MPRITAATLLTLLLVAGQHAAAQTATVVNLSCDGTKRMVGDDKRNPVTGLGLVVNLVDQTVTGFGIVAHIEHADAARITFGGEGPALPRKVGGGHLTDGTISLSGELDRVTGALSVETSTAFAYNKTAPDVDFFNLVARSRTACSEKGQRTGIT